MISKVQSEVLIHDFFAYLKDLRHERLNHSIVPLGEDAAGQAHRLQIITDLETTFQSRKNAWIVKLKAELAPIAASCATSAGKRSHNVNKEHVSSCDRLILKVIDFDPFPDPSFVSMVHHIPPAPVYYVDMYLEQWGAFWKSRMTGDVFASFYHCLSEVIDIEANFNHPIMKKIMAATVGEAAMDTWEYYLAPRRENAHRQKHPNARVRKATKEVHDKLVRYNFRDVFHKYFAESPDFPKHPDQVQVPIHSLGIKSSKRKRVYSNRPARPAVNWDALPTLQ